MEDTKFTKEQEKAISECLSKLDGSSINKLNDAKKEIDDIDHYKTLSLILKTLKCLDEV